MLLHGLGSDLEKRRLAYIFEMVELSYISVVYIYLYYRACSPPLTETNLENLLKYNVFSRNFDDYSEVIKVI